MKCKNGKCLIGSCKITKIYSRGLCSTHYKMISRLVRAGKRTWEEFIEVGMAKRGERGRNTQQSFLLKEMMKKKNLNPQ